MSIDYQMISLALNVIYIIGLVVVIPIVKSLIKLKDRDMESSTLVLINDAASAIRKDAAEQKKETSDKISEMDKKLYHVEKMQARDMDALNELREEVRVELKEFRKSIDGIYQRIDGIMQRIDDRLNAVTTNLKQELSLTLIEALTKHGRKDEK